MLTSKEIIEMQPNTKLLVLFQTTVSIWILSFAFMVLVWGWAYLFHQETRGLKRPGLNLREL
jgi:hypothetical protein